MVFVGGQGFHRQRVDLFAHAVTQRRVDDLVALDQALAGKLGRDTTFKFVNFLMRKLGCKLTNPGIPASDFEVRLRSGIPSDPGVFDSDDFLLGVLDFTLYIVLKVLLLEVHQVRI